MERLAYYVVHHRRLVIGAWILLTVLLPFIGSLIYWNAREPSESEIEDKFRGQDEMRRTGSGPRR